jgi:hypothetical protein
MNVHPSSTVVPLGPTIDEAFAADALYEIKIDTNGDAVPDIAYRINFSRVPGGVQTASLFRVEGAEAAGTAGGGQAIVENAPVCLGREIEVAESGAYRFFTGWRSDPFFFDPLGALNDFQFAGQDFFADKDVCAIVLELPNAALGVGEVGLWARTLVKVGDSWIQADRGARPAQAVFLPGDDRNAYLAAAPADDARFIATFAHSLEHAGGYSPDEARRVAGTLLPDILRFDPRRAASYPSNGRALTDDVLDHFLAILTKGKVMTDKVGPHTDLLATFPYLGPPHTIRS